MRARACALRVYWGRDRGCKEKFRAARGKFWAPGADCVNGCGGKFWARGPRSDVRAIHAGAPSASALIFVIRPTRLILEKWLPKANSVGVS